MPLKVASAIKFIMKMNKWKNNNIQLSNSNQNENLQIVITCTKCSRCKNNTPTPIWSRRMVQYTKDGRKRSDLWDPTLVVVYFFS